MSDALARLGRFVEDETWPSHPAAVAFVAVRDELRGLRAAASETARLYPYEGRLCRAALVAAHGAPLGRDELGGDFTEEAP